MDDDNKRETQHGAKRDFEKNRLSYITLPACLVTLWQMNAAARYFFFSTLIK